MKLKKIASLALVGAMAVSMLAGCKGGNGAGNGTTGGNDEPTVTTSSIVDAVNKGQSAANTVKINFTVDSKLDSALKRAVDTLGVKASVFSVKNAVQNMTGYESKSPVTGWTGQPDLVVKIDNWFAKDYFLSGGADYDFDYTPKADGAKNIGSEDGKVYTTFGVVKIHATNEEYVLNKVAHQVDELVAKLAKTSNDANNDGKLDDEKVGDGSTAVVAGTGDTSKYYAYSYDGSMSMVSIETENGTTDYYVAWIVNQTIATKTLG